MSTQTSIEYLERAISVLAFASDRGRDPELSLRQCMVLGARRATNEQRQQFIALAAPLAADVSPNVASRAREVLRLFGAAAAPKYAGKNGDAAFKEALHSAGLYDGDRRYYFSYIADRLWDAGRHDDAVAARKTIDPGATLMTEQSRADKKAADEKRKTENVLCASLDDADSCRAKLSTITDREKLVTAAVAVAKAFDNNGDAKQAREVLDNTFVRLNQWAPSMNS